MQEQNTEASRKREVLARLFEDLTLAILTPGFWVLRNTSIVFKKKILAGQPKSFS